MTVLTPQTVPAADGPPDAATTDAATTRPSQIRRTLMRRSMGRRALLRLGLGGGIAVGMSVIGWLPPARPRSAAAAREHLNCSIYTYDGVLCIGGAVSTAYCSAGWHRGDYVRFDSCNWRNYNPLVTRCSGLAAWRWPHGTQLWRCADGERWQQLNCGTVTHIYTICSHRLR